MSFPYKWKGYKAAFPPERPEKPKPDCLTLNIPVVPREEWNAAPPTAAETPDVDEVMHVIVGHTGTRWCLTSLECRNMIKKLQDKHMSQGETDIKYNFLVGADGKVYEGRGLRWHPFTTKPRLSTHFLVGADGKVYEGRGWRVVPAASRIWPEVTRNCLRIAYIGTFRKPKQPPRRMVGPCWDLMEVGFVRDHLALDFTVHQSKHLPTVFNFTNEQEVMGIDTF